MQQHILQASTHPSHMRLCLVLILLLCVACTQQEHTRIAAWNLQVYGDAKASNDALLATYANVISRYDIVVLQEIRDADGSSIRALCLQLEGYTCNVSSRAGRSSSKEQYVIAYRNATLLELRDFNPDAQDRWERPPIRATFLVGNETFVLYVIHTKPDDARAEIRALENLVTTTTRDEERVIVLGDLNADCAYYDAASDDAFDSWLWAIRSDTTIGNSKCVYDRILLNGPAERKVVRSGIDRENITAEVSDHALVWVGIT